MIVEFLVARGVQRVYGLVGGHIQPLWDELSRHGVQIVDVRHECAAVHMAHAEAILMDRLAVVMVTAGPGLTNAITGIANAHVSRAPVLVISGRTPRPQVGRGAMQDIPQAAIVQPICRRAEVVSERPHVLPRLDAVMRAALGADGPTGPAYIDFPTDLLRETVSEAEFDADWLPEWRPSSIRPDPGAVSEAAKLLRRARRPLVLSGRGARRSREALVRFLDATGALYLDTADSRGAVLSTHPASVPALRAQAMREADVVLTLGRRLDFQLAYGSRAVFAPDAKLIRIGRTVDEISDNRRGAVEIQADVVPTLTELIAADPVPQSLDRAWRELMVAANADRAGRLAKRLRQAPPGSDGRMHPYTLIAALNDSIDENTIVVADGGDILSFARVALKFATFYLDPGGLGMSRCGCAICHRRSAQHARPPRRGVDW